MLKEYQSRRIGPPSSIEIPLSRRLFLPCRHRQRKSWSEPAVAVATTTKKWTTTTEQWLGSGSCCGLTIRDVFSFYWLRRQAKVSRPRVFSTSFGLLPTVVVFGSSLCLSRFVVVANNNNEEKKNTSVARPVSDGGWSSPQSSILYFFLPFIGCG